MKTWHRRSFAAALAIGCVLVAGADASRAGAWSHQIGEPCNAVLETEVVEHGWTLVEASPRTGEESFFAVLQKEVDGAAATAAYLCNSASIATHSLVMEVASENEGRAAFSMWRTRLEKLLGVPEIDADEPTLGAVSESLGLPLRRGLTWLPRRGRVNLDLGRGLRGWQVGIVALGVAPPRDRIRDWFGDFAERTRTNGQPTCPEQWVYRFARPDPVDGKHVLVVGFDSAGQFCRLNSYEESVNVVQPAWSARPVSITYPITAELEGLQGRAVLEFTVDEDRSAREISIIEASDARFAAAARDAFGDLKLVPHAFEDEEFPYVHTIVLPFAFE